MLVIRLTKMGRKGEAKYRIVVKEKRSKRDGRAVATIGWYEKRAGGVVRKDINQQQVSHWLSQGAKPSPTVAKILAL